MLNPCGPCVRPFANCDQCIFKLGPAKENHRLMKELLRRYAGGEESFEGRNCAEMYARWHPDWIKEIEEGEETPKVEEFIELEEEEK